MSTEDNGQSHPDRLATAVTNRRQRLGLTRKQVADAAGISVRSLGYVESGYANHWPRPATLAGLDRALRWSPGSARRVYERGGRPGHRPSVRPQPKPQDKPQDEPTEALVVRAARLPRPVELTLLEHLAARRQDMEAVLEAEARMMVELLGPMLTGRNPDGPA